MIPAPRLLVFSDLTLVPEALLLERVARLCRLAEPGTVSITLRDKELPARERLSLGRKLASAARAGAQYFGVADSLDLTRLLDAEALHLGEGSVGAEDARRLVGPNLFLTRAVHDPAQASDAARDVQGVLLSPVLAARKGRPALGLAGLERACALVSGSGARVYALGGISAENAAACLAGGATGAAVIGAALKIPDPLALLRSLGIARAASLGAG